MVYCPNCGMVNKDDANFCNDCGGEIRYDGKSKPKIDYSTRQPSSPAYSQSSPDYRQPTSSYRPSRTHQVADEAAPLYYCCSFCIPIVGLVLWLVWKNERPNTAYSMLILGIVGFILDFMLGVFSA